MASVKGPLFSFEASGSLKKIITFSQWKGRNYVRTHTIPFNPQSAKQVNMRTAFTLLIAEWQGEIGSYQTEWNEFAKQFQMAGFNQYVSRGQKAYIDQIGNDTLPTSVSVSGTPPGETFVWSSA